MNRMKSDVNTQITQPLYKTVTKSPKRKRIRNIYMTCKKHLWTENSKFYVQAKVNITRKVSKLNKFGLLSVPILSMWSSEWVLKLLTIFHLWFASGYLPLPVVNTFRRFLLCVLDKFWLSSEGDVQLCLLFLIWRGRFCI